MEFIQQNKEIILSITIGIVFAYIIISVLRIFTTTSNEKADEIIGFLLDIIEEIRDLGRDSVKEYMIENTLKNIEEHLENIERFTELTEEHTCILRNDYHYKHYYEKGCYDESCTACWELRETFVDLPCKPPEQDPTQ